MNEHGEDAKDRLLYFPVEADDDSTATGHSPHDLVRSEQTTEEMVIAMLKHAGPRDPSPEDVKNHVFDHVQGVWKQQVERQAAARRRWYGSIAAALILFGVLGWWWRFGLSEPLVDSTSTPSNEIVARVVVWDSPSPAPFEVGAELEVGYDLATTNTERAALDMAGVSLRLDHNTRVRLLAVNSVELLAGQVYIDAGEGTEPHQDAAKIEIRTSFGHASDIGTQFLVRIEPHSLKVQVREGRVKVVAQNQRHEAAEGAQITVNAEGQAKVTPLTDDQDWSWALAAAPVFDLEGANLAEALHWIGRETGLRIEYQDRELAAEAESIVTHGSLDGLTPAQAPELILATAGLGYSIDEERLYVHRLKTP